MSNTPSPVRRWAVPITVIVAAVVLFITAISLGQGRTDSPEEGSQAAGEGPVEVEAVETPDLSDIERRDEGDPLAVGPVDAPVGLVIFDDYQCPFCAQWSQDTLPLMMERVEEGELRIEWRQVNVFGDASLRAAQAAYAAALQG
ncbi:MAG: thioredoxin domain-containing protein, partial [Brevibacterium aurantiacum]